MQPPIAGPEFRVIGEPGAREQLRVDVADADADAEQLVVLDEGEQLGGSRHDGLRELFDEPEHACAIAQPPQRELAGHPRMRHRPPLLEHRDKRGVTVAEVIDPDRRVDQDHAAAERRRGAAVNSGWVPPRRARRRALGGPSAISKMRAVARDRRS
jgi:hypothetical protein